MQNCGRCHECGHKLRTVLDGEEWCDHCGQYRRYKSHGWGEWGEGKWRCPEPPKPSGTPLLASDLAEGLP